MIYLLLKLILILSVTTIIIEGCLFSMNFVKNIICNGIEDEQLNDLLIIYI